MRDSRNILERQRQSATNGGRGGEPANFLQPNFLGVWLLRRGFCDNFTVFGTVLYTKKGIGAGDRWAFRCGG
jgi:hypothetical protein